jgi:hypothetical protein
MAFLKQDIKKELTLPSLIDIIFLLLVFSLVTQPISPSGRTEKTSGTQPQDMDLPFIQGFLATKTDPLLNTLMFEIGYADPRNPGSRRVVYALYPVPGDSSTVSDAKQRAVRDSTFAFFPDAFLELTDSEFSSCTACRFIRNEVEQYKKAHFFKPSHSNAIEIRAEKGIEFRILNYVLTLCSVYGDTVPGVAVRTLGGREL